MRQYKTEQCRVHHRGRVFHFVSYDGHLARPERGIDAAPPAWFLMVSGRRRAVMEQTIGLDAAAQHRYFVAWLDTHIFAPA